jgi:hypothetical protein
LCPLLSEGQRSQRPTLEWHPANTTSFPTLKSEAPSALAAFKLNFFFLSKQKVAEAKNLISQDGRTRRVAYQSQQGMMIDEARKKEHSKN